MNTTTRTPHVSRRIAAICGNLIVATFLATTLGANAVADESTITRVEDNPNKPATTTGIVKPQWGESAARERAIENGVKQTPPPGAKAPASLSGTKKKNLSDIPCRPGDFAEVDDKHYMCMGGTWIIDKQADASKTNNIRKRNICVHRCTREGGITICRGDGKACDGKRPW